MHQHTSSFKKEDEWHHERVKKDSDQELQARTLKWREKLFICQRISSRTACFKWYLRDKDEATQQRQKVTKEAKTSTQLLNTISHDWRKSYSLFHCWRRRTRRVQVSTSRQWFITCMTWCIEIWRWHKTEFIMQSCFSSKQCLHLQACSMRTWHMWVITALRWWT